MGHPPEEYSYVEIANQNLLALTGEFPVASTNTFDIPVKLRTELTRLLNLELGYLEELKKSEEIMVKNGRSGSEALMGIDKSLHQTRQKILELQNSRSLPGSLRLLADPEPIDDVLHRADWINLLTEELNHLHQSESRLTTKYTEGVTPMADILNIKIEIAKLQQKIAIYDEYAIQTGVSVTGDSPIKESEEVRQFRKIVQDSPDRLSSSGQNGMTLLHEAILTENADVAALVLDAGADPNAYAQDDYDIFANPSPLALAIKLGNKRMIESLLDAGADPNGLIRFNNKFLPFENRALTPLYYSYTLGNAEIVELFIKNHALWVDRETTYSPYHPAIINNDLLTINQMIEAKVPINEVGEFLDAGKAHPAFPEFPMANAWCKNVIIAEKLIEAGADPLLHKSISPLLFAIQQGDLSKFKRLVAIGYDINEASNPNNIHYFYKPWKNEKKYPFGGGVTALSCVLENFAFSYDPPKGESQEIFDYIINNGGFLKCNQYAHFTYSSVLEACVVHKIENGTYLHLNIIEKLLSSGFDPPFLNAGAMDMEAYLMFIDDHMRLVDGITEYKASDRNIIETYVEKNSFMDYEVYRHYQKPVMNSLDTEYFVDDMLWVSLRDIDVRKVRLENYSLIYKHWPIIIGSLEGDVPFLVKTAGE